MSDELLQKLKDTGFKDSHIDNYLGGNGKEQLRYIPTLCQLIEALGDEFKKLERFDNDKWLAWHIGGYIGGKTAEEAVANCWLKLNENKS